MTLYFSCLRVCMREGEREREKGGERRTVEEGWLCLNGTGTAEKGDPPPLSHSDPIVLYPPLLP